MNVLYLCYETECPITKFFSEEQNTLPKYVIKISKNVFGVTYSGFFLRICKAGFSGQAIFYLLIGDIPSE